ncbi:MAG: efflux RND transporter periplasmic adaptor subunit [Nitrospirota bacterium]
MNLFKQTLFIFIAFMFSTSLISCNKKEETREEVIRPVRYQQVFLSGGKRTRTFSGISKAGTEAKLSFRVGEVIEALNVKVGEKVKKGRLIAAIDDSDARLNYEKALSALRKTETQKENAKSNLDRVKDLYENNNVSLSEYESAKDQYASANSSFNTEKKNADLKKRELSYYKLYAPMDGIIVKVPVEKNEQVSPGLVVAEISSENDIEVTVGMPEAFIPRVKADEKVSVKFLSLQDRVFDGIISEVSFAAGSESSTYPVIVKIQHSTGDIRPGMPADVTFHFTSGEKKERLVVPANAVGEDTEGNFVYTVIASENGLAVVNKKAVTVSNLTREGFEISKGLQDGELVVTAGIANLSDGMKVRLLK